MDNTRYIQQATKLAEFCATKDYKYNRAFDAMMDEYGLDYALSKLEEKLYRMKQLKQLEILDKSESFLDSVKDLWGYSLLLILYLTNEEAEKDKAQKKEIHRQLMKFYGGDING